AVGCGACGGDQVMTSTNGTSWTARSAAGNNDALTSVTYGNDSFVAVGCAAGNCAGFNPVIVSTSGTTVPGGIGTATFNDDASVADLSISDTSEVVAPIAVSISGDYTNLGSANWNGGTTTFNGTSAQIATGTM